MAEIIEVSLVYVCVCVCVCVCMCVCVSVSALENMVTIANVRSDRDMAEIIEVSLNFFLRNSKR